MPSVAYVLVGVASIANLAATILKIRTGSTRLITLRLSRHALICVTVLL